MCTISSWLSPWTSHGICFMSSRFIRQHLQVGTQLNLPVQHFEIHLQPTHPLPKPLPGQRCAVIIIRRTKGHSYHEIKYVIRVCIRHSTIRVQLQGQWSTGCRCTGSWMRLQHLTQSTQQLLANCSFLSTWVCHILENWQYLSIFLWCMKEKGTGTGWNNQLWYCTTAWVLVCSFFGIRN